MKNKCLLIILFAYFVSFELISQRKDLNLIQTSLFDNIPVRNIGPAKVSGRITKVLKDYSNTSTWYVSTASGNVWKTENSGTTWKPIFEHYGSYSIGTIAMLSLIHI